MNPKILFVMTSADRRGLRDGTTRPTGYWAEEFAEPYEKFTQAGCQVDIATLRGAPAALDPASVQFGVAQGHNPQLSRPQLQQFDETIKAAAPELQHPIAIETLTPQQLKAYDAVFVVGGQGPMQDLANAPDMGHLVATAHANNTLVAAVCHGTAGLLQAQAPGGGWLFKGYRVTGYSDAEENTSSPTSRGLPFYLQDALEAVGGHYSASPELWGAHVVEDRNLITGENPASSGPLADAVLARLQP